ncbi:MAG: DUF4837 family protein [Candidatus Eisenbacteria bacterium]
MTRIMRLATLALLAALLSCGGPMVAAFGESNDVVIIRSDQSGAEAATLLNRALTAESDWLVGEERFQTTIAGPSRLSGLTNRRHIVLLGTWDDPEMADLVSSRVRGLEPAGPPGTRVVTDIWAEGQVVLAVMGKDGSELSEYIREHGADIADELELAARDRLAGSLRDFVEDTEFDVEMEGRFGWSLCPPRGYDLHTANEDRGLVFFRRVRPDRTLFVYWQDGGDADVTQEFVVATRNRLGTLYFDGDEIEWRREFVVASVDFGGRPALEVSGWWGNRELVGGGPFRAYCFAEPSQGRVYLLDAALFAPATDKTPLMRNLDAALHTFRAAR